MVVAVLPTSVVVVEGRLRVSVEGMVVKPDGVVVMYKVTHFWVMAVLMMMKMRVSNLMS